MQRNKKPSRIAGMALAGVLSILGIAQQAHAGPGVIHQAVDAVINSGGVGFGSIHDTHNMSGLAVPYVNDNTNFDAYVATTLHTPLFATYEWFSDLGTTSASVTYDLNDLFGFDAIAYWNEESAGAGLLDIYVSADNVNFFVLATGLQPTDNPVAPYLADVFALAATNIQYVRFDLSACPQQPAGFESCSIGEVAFRRPPGITDIPEPGSLALLGIGLAGLNTVRRRKHRA